MPRFLAQIAIIDGHILAPAVVDVFSDGNCEINPFVGETPATLAADGVAVAIPYGFDPSSLPRRLVCEPLREYAERLLPLLPSAPTGAVVFMP